MHERDRAALELCRQSRTNAFERCEHPSVLRPFSQTKLPIQLKARRSVSPNIFISYAREDREHVQRLQALLGAVVGESAIFVDQEKVRAGTTWTLELARAIVDSTHFVVIWSRRARDSHWVNQEVTSVIELCREQPLRRIIPVRIDPTPLPAELEAFEGIDLFGNKNGERSLSAVVQLATSVAIVAGLALAIRRASPVLFGLVAMWVALAAFVALRFAPRLRAATEARRHDRLLRALDVTPRALKVLFVGGCACALWALGQMG